MAKSGITQWNGEAVFGFFEEKAGKKLNAAAVLVQNEARRLMALPKHGENTFLISARRKNVPEGAALVIKERVIKGRKRTKKYFRLRRSAPGEAPAIETGHLRRATQWDAPDKMTRRVGYLGDPNPTKKKGDYGFALEYGTAKMAPRPALRPALHHMRKEIMRLFRG